jgi:hypothetical protein
MKTIKVILGIISFFVLFFLGTGLLVKETNYSAQVSINKPLREVFKTFNNSEKIKNWIPEIRSIKVVNSNPGKTGSVYKIVLENQGQEITMTQKVMAYIENEKVTLFFDAEKMLKKDDYLFTEKDGITTISLNASCVSDSYLMACVFPYSKSIFQKQDQNYLNNFKKFSENQ